MYKSRWNSRIIVQGCKEQLHIQICMKIYKICRHINENIKECILWFHAFPAVGVSIYKKILLRGAKVTMNWLILILICNAVRCIGTDTTDFCQSGESVVGIKPLRLGACSARRGQKLEGCICEITCIVYQNCRRYFQKTMSTVTYSWYN